MGTVDLTLALALLYFTMRSYWRGLLGTLAAYAAPVLGVMIASEYGDVGAALLRDYVTAPDAVLRILAFPLIFLVTVFLMRAAAVIAARVLQVGISLPGRLLAGALGATLGAVLLGTCILLLHAFVPSHTAADGDAPGRVLTDKAVGVMETIERRVDDSFLGPRLAAIAGTVVNQVFEMPPEKPAASDAAKAEESQTR